MTSLVEVYRYGMLSIAMREDRFVALGVLTNGDVRIVQTRRARPTATRHGVDARQVAV